MYLISLVEKKIQNNNWNRDKNNIYNNYIQNINSKNLNKITIKILILHTAYNVYKLFKVTYILQ